MSRRKASPGHSPVSTAYPPWRRAAGGEPRPGQPLYHRTGSHIFSPSSSCILYSVTVPCKSVGTDREEAIAAATMNPAKSIGIYDEVGSLTPGKRNILNTARTMLSWIWMPSLICNEASGNKIRLVTLAPNVEGAMEFRRSAHRPESS